MPNTSKLALAGQKACTEEGKEGFLNCIFPILATLVFVPVLHSKHEGELAHNHISENVPGKEEALDSLDPIHLPHVFQHIPQDPLYHAKNMYGGNALFLPLLIERD